ncbi:MAG: DUF4177 domain-containing protein [Oscillospiraceae bacterium]|nr:DUF4177 domain-containing protein [Clostridia bacterium]MBQ3242546.1 DUF4177 domain-containing protein [Oscillospiraceae bacterium]MBR6607288.1 DUF4177 domain-containing protein [Oscillospiraceae bacterium]
MKQYKVVRVKMTFEELGTVNFTRLETIMNDMAKEGWDVVCLSPQPGISTNFLLVTFCKDDE